MVLRLVALPWKTVGRGVALAYGISFAFGIVLLANDITPQTDQTLFPLLALLSGGIGVAMALGAMGTTRAVYVLAIGVGLWLINLGNVLLGSQALSDWMDSCIFIAATVLLGRMLLGNSLAPLPAGRKTSCES